MSAIIDRLTPTHYRLMRIAFELCEGVVVAQGDFAIYNIDGVQIITDNVMTFLNTQEQVTFLAWVNGKIAAYEAATGLSPRGE